MNGTQANNLNYQMINAGISKKNLTMGLRIHAFIMKQFYSEAEHGADTVADVKFETIHSFLAEICDRMTTLLKNPNLDAFLANPAAISTTTNKSRNLTGMSIALNIVQLATIKEYWNARFVSATMNSMPGRPDASFFKIDATNELLETSA